MADADLAVPAVKELKAAQTQRSPVNGQPLLMTDVDRTLYVEFV